MAIIVGVDIGGTFTDLVALDEATGRLHLVKGPTTSKEPSEGVAHLLEALGRGGQDAGRFIHGTTVAINILIERRGARTGLVTTAGFRDSLEIGRSNRPDMYNFLYRKPTPFVPRRHRFEVRERMDAQGAVVTPLDEGEVRAVAARCREEDIESLAVCFLNSYLNPLHERRCAEVVSEVLPLIPVTTSSDLTREWREYERASTAVLNAYVLPMTRAYLARLHARLRDWGLAVEPWVMLGNGGAGTFARGEAAPLHLVESGSVAGVLGAAALGRLLGMGDLVTLDIGGTTAKTSLLEEGRMVVRTDYRLEANEFSPGYPIALPMVDVVELGAGGGSILWADVAGGLHVGPRSAGAEPGPACYPQGGSEPTLTDAHLVAGTLNPDYFLGGRIRLDGGRARASLEPLASELGMRPEHVALGAIRLAVANMVEALKLVSVARGHDPRDFTLLAFGGAGPMHAALVARELRIRRIVIPPAPAHFSAWGMLVADARQDLVATRVTPLEEDLRGIWGRFSELEEEAAAALVAQGFAASRITFSHSLDMRYRGQHHVVEVLLPPGAVGRVEAPDLRNAFHGAHRKRYSFALEGDEVEVVNLRLQAMVPAPRIPPPEVGFGEGDALKGRRPALLLGRPAAPVHDRGRLRPGDIIQGPAIVEEEASTTLIVRGQSATVDPLGDLVIQEGA